MCNITILLMYISSIYQFSIFISFITGNIYLYVSMYRACVLIYFSIISLFASPLASVSNYLSITLTYLSIIYTFPPLYLLLPIRLVNCLLHLCIYNFFYTFLSLYRLRPLCLIIYLSHTRTYQSAYLYISFFIYLLRFTWLLIYLSPIRICLFSYTFLLPHLLRSVSKTESRRKMIYKRSSRRVRVKRKRRIKGNITRSGGKKETKEEKKRGRGR